MNKRKAITLLTVVIAIALLLALALPSCGTSCNHTDADNDGKCDKCGAALTSEPNGSNGSDGSADNPPCTEHKDENNDGKCDICGADYTPPCTEHVDADDDGKCDKCGTDFTDGCDFHVDDDDDGMCDKCGTADETKLLPLVVGSNANFKIVYNKSEATNELSQAISSLVAAFRRVNVPVSTSPDEYAYLVQEYEILVGTVRNRPDYSINTVPYGYLGYVIKVIDNKVIIIGTSKASTLEAFNYFTSNILKISDASTDLKNLYVRRDTDVLYSDSYSIDSVNISGNDIAGYAILCESNNEQVRAAATYIQYTLYKCAGYALPIVEAKESGRKYIELRLTDIDRSTDAYYAEVDGSDLIIRCPYPAFYEEYTKALIDKYIYRDYVGDIELGDSFRDVADLSHYVSYSDYGAVGDGITDDFDAIAAAHAAANLTMQTVIADKGKTYNLGVHTTSIEIRTDVIWDGASFIIDDSAIEPGTKESKTDIFTVASDTAPISISGIGALTKASTSIGTSFDEAKLVVLYNANVKRYIRYGQNENDGQTQREVILVDKNGNINPSTPLLWDYDTVTSAIAYSANDRPITISGGTFTTIANCAPRAYTYYARGIAVSRSNTTVDGLTHLITGEGESGAPYNGFLNPKNTTNITFKNVVYSGHKTYTLATDEKNSMGSYDISPSMSNDIRWINCSQANDYMDTSLWGVMGSNYCKNMTYDSCTLSRFDAHEGMYNATIINSDIGHVGINAIGAGTLRVENTVIHKNHVINLRNDYGSTWEGDVIIKDVTLVNSSTVLTLFNGSYNNHNFGYTCYLPQNIVIDNLMFDKKPSKVYVLPYFNGIDTSAATVTINGNNAENVNRIVPTETVTVKNNAAGCTYYLSSNTSALFAATEFITD